MLPVRSSQPLKNAAFDAVDTVSPVVNLLHGNGFTAYAMADTPISACTVSVEITPDGLHWISAGTLAVANSANTLAKLTVTDKAIQIRFRQQTACTGEKMTLMVVE